MPHIILEYTDNLTEDVDFQGLFFDLHQILVVVASAELESCKSRAIEHQCFYIGSGAPENAFVHVEILLAEGRPMPVRQEVGRQVLGILEGYFTRSLEELNLQITVEIKEFSKALYFKTYHQ